MYVYTTITTTILLYYYYYYYYYYLRFMFIPTFCPRDHFRLGQVP